MTELTLGIGLIVVIAAIGLWLERRGRIAEREKQQRESLESVDVRREVERDVAREPDPRQRLRDKWSRPVPGQSADPDQ